MQKQTEAEVIREAFRYQSALTSYAYGMLRDWSLAKDAVQDAFVVLVEKYADNDPASGVFPLVKKIVRFKVLELLRKRRREITVENEELDRMVGDTLEGAVSEDDMIRHNQRLCALHECMSRLNETLRKLLVAFYWNHQTCEEVAKATGRSAPSLRVTLMRVRGKLHECMDKRLKNAEVMP